MNIDQKLSVIRDLVQHDIGNRGLARDPQDNLLIATKGDFENACRSIAEHPSPAVMVGTGFFIPTAQPPAFETDGPVGAVFLARAFDHLGFPVVLLGGLRCYFAMHAGAVAAGLKVPHIADYLDVDEGILLGLRCRGAWPHDDSTHRIAIERPGPAADSKAYTMRGFDVSSHAHGHWRFASGQKSSVTIGIGDGGNEIGMGKIPHDTIVKNIPNGDLIHCRVATDHLIIAGVSNWGAYALAAGVALLRGAELPTELFDPDREREILQVMVDAGPLVDGVTGKQTATVDGLSCDDYIRPLVEIGKIVRGSDVAIPPC